MAVLHSRVTSGIERKHYGLGSYLVVALVAVAVGVGAAAGFAQVVGEASLTGTHEATVVRGDAVGSNLPELWESGIAQQAAVNEAALMQNRIGVGVIQGQAIQQQALINARIDSGLAQQAVIHEQQLLQSRIESGLAQRAAIAQRYELLQGRIESGLVQAQAIQSVGAFREAWTMRGQEMSKYVDALTASGLAASSDSFSSAWATRGEEMTAHLGELITSGQAQQAAVQNR